MKWLMLIVLPWALVGCVQTRATTEVLVCLDAEALQDIRWPNREALAWADAQVQTWTSPQSILAALEKDGRDEEYQALLRRALEGGGWGMDWDFLLEKAMIYDHRAVGRLAVAGGADPNRRVRRVFEASLNVKTDLEGALYVSLLETFLEEDVRATSPEGVPLLLLTQANARAQHFLLDMGADPNGWPVGGVNGGLRSGIEGALMSNDMELVRHYVDCGADITSYPVAGFTDSPEIAAWLIERGATLRADATHLSPLQAALIRGHTETARVLLRHEPLNQKMPFMTYDFTALGIAACKHSPLVPDLLDAGYDPHCSVKQAFSVALALVSRGDLVRFRRYGFSPDANCPWLPDDDMPENTAPKTLLSEALRDLFSASEERCARAVRAANLLLDLGANPQTLVYAGSVDVVDGREVAENLPLSTWFAKCFEDRCAKGSPELRALYRRIVGKEPLAKPRR